MENQEVCSLGKAELKSGQTARCKGKISGRDAINQSDLRLIRIRSGVVKKKSHVCEWHFSKWVTYYASNQDICCNPFAIHADGKKGKSKV